VQISPRYDGAPIITLDGPPAAIAEPLVRQRRRLATTLADLTDEQWRAPSRCDGWSAQDVVAHLVTVDQFWAISILSGVQGEPTRMLQGFDPKASPAAMVDAARGATPAETYAAFVEGNTALVDLAAGLDDRGWEAMAEAPPGVVSVSALAHQALWDCWVHERDILEPLGIAQAEEHDEVIASLRYAAALGAAFALPAGSTRTGTLVLDVIDLRARVVVAVADAVVTVHDGDGSDDLPEDAVLLRGDGVDLLETLSIRAPLTHPIPDDRAWLLAGLSEVFEAS
jgi:uncharacterized protein (TIGR03083 family)